MGRLPRGLQEQQGPPLHQPEEPVGAALDHPALRWLHRGHQVHQGAHRAQDRQQRRLVHLHGHLRQGGRPHDHRHLEQVHLHPEGLLRVEEVRPQVQQVRRPQGWRLVHHLHVHGHLQQQGDQVPQPPQRGPRQAGHHDPRRRPDGLRGLELGQLRRCGATCMDQVDGNISQDVEVSGDVVNLARVGTYKIFYNCQDTAKNRADTATRTVTVQDTTCPTCYFKKGRTQHRTLVLEASFPYTDQFAKDVKCSDELTADITPVPTTYNSNANGKIDLTSKFTGKSITDQTGIYFTVYKATDDTKNSNIISKPGFGGNNCKFQTLDSEGKPTALAYTSSEYTRTITVKDTLRPVIKLSLKDAKNNNVIIKAGAAAKSSAADISYQQADASFPQPDGANKPHTVSSHTWKLMAEETTSSVNGWVLGAIASAVSGLALLGYSLRKQAQPVATSVPV